MCDHCSTHSYTKKTKVSDDNRGDIITTIAESLRTFSTELNGHPIAPLKDQKNNDLSHIKKEISKLSDDVLVQLFNLTGWVE